MSNQNDATFNLAMIADRVQDVPMCQEKGCVKGSIKCTIPSGINEDGSEYAESYEYYCPKHAKENGFCFGCGEFIAGIGGLGDMCDNCQSEFDDNDDYYDRYSNNPFDDIE